MRAEAAALLAFMGTNTVACLGQRSAATFPDGAVADGAVPRPPTQRITVQAAFNDTTFFLRVHWVSGALAPALSVALSDRRPATGVRDFAVAGCFLGCHDSSNDMPNWQPEDGERPMHLLPGFGGPADVWLWKALPGDPAGQAAATAMGTQGMNDDPDAGAGGLVGLANGGSGAWDVVYARTLAAPSAGTALVPGTVYDLGFAVHPDGIEGRNHYVSLPVALALGVPGPALVATALPAGAPPDFSDAATFPVLDVDLFLPGITSFEFLVGAAVDRNGQLRKNDVRHGGAGAVATGSHACSDCHRVVSDAVVPPVENAGALERLVLRRGGVMGPAAVGGTP